MHNTSILSKTAECERKNKSYAEIFCLPATPTAPVDDILCIRRLEVKGHRRQRGMGVKGA